VERGLAVPHYNEMAHKAGYLTESRLSTLIPFALQMGWTFVITLNGCWSCW
jgi:hypothetical protein